MSSTVQYFPVLDRTCIEKIIDAWKADFPQMGVLALLPESAKPDVLLLQEILSEREVSLVGGVFPALVVDGVFRAEGCWLLRLDEAPFSLLLENLPRDADGAVRTANELSAQLRAQIGVEGTEMTLLMLFDAMLPNIATMLDEIYLKLANRVHYAGANAGSETFQPMPCLFDNKRVAGNALLAVLIRNHHGAILEHGYTLPEYSCTATSTEGNRISHIDWEPAFEVYCELVRTQFDIEVTRDNFYHYAVHFPFGIVRANHNVLVRIPVALGEDGSLFCVGEVPPHSVLSLLDAPRPDSHHTVDTLVQRLTQLNGGVSGRDMLLFYCAGRRMHLGKSAAEAEVQEMQRQSKARQTVGALSLGEIGASSIRGYPLFHNATLVTMLW